MRHFKSLLRFIADDRGVGSILMLCLLPLFLVLCGLGMDGTAAFRTREMLQSTADSAAIAAALKLPTAGSATAAQTNSAIDKAFEYSLANMSGFGHVLNLNAATNGDIQFGNWNGNTFTSPAASGTAENAIEVTVKTAAANGNAYPTSFLALIGKSSWDIAATAIAMNGVPKPVCIFATTSFLVNGGPSINLHGCTMAVNGPMACNGGGVGAGYAISSSPSQGKDCGQTNLYNQPATADPYAALASNIPVNPCGATAASYPQEVPGHGNSPPTLAASNQWPGGSVWPTGVHVDASTGAHIMCGDVQLTGNVSLSGNETLVIENGKLDVGSNSLTTTGSGSLTIIMTGPTIAGLTPAHNLVGSASGSLNITGPSSGTWKQMVFYQDKTLVDTSGSLDINEGGQGNNSGPIWNISGVMYLPNAQFNINGLVSPATNAPNACFTLVASAISISGTGQILAEPACTTAPTTLVPISRLVE